MAELKTRPGKSSVKAFIDSVPDAEARRDCKALVRMMREATGCAPKMWGTSVVGFGTYHYRYASGREGDWFLAGFSPRKRDLTIYIMSGFAGHGQLLRRLGKHKTGSSCLYVKRLADLDDQVLRQLLGDSVATVRERYG